MLLVFKDFSRKWEPKTKAKEKKQKIFLCMKRYLISRALLETKFISTEAETMPLFFLKFILAKS